MTPFDLSGYWWLPDNPDSQTPGRLSFGYEEGARLRLIGSPLDEIQTFQIMGTWGVDYSPEVILGVAENGKEYTLTRCTLAGSRSCNGFMTTEFAPSMIIEGRHFPDLASLVFGQMSVKLSHLDHWYGVTGKELATQLESQDTISISFSYTIPPPLDISFDGGKARLGHSWRFNQPNLSHDFVLSEGVGFTVIPDTPFNLSEFFDDWLPLIRGWISLCVGLPISVMEMSGKAQVDILDNKSSDLRAVRSVSFYLKSNRYDDEDKYLIPHEMICSFNDLGNSIDEYFRKWVALVRRAKPAVQLYLSEFLSGTTVFPDTFLGAVRAMEAYHGYERESAVIPQSEHLLRVASIIDATPELHREWLRKTLEYSNRKRLKVRLAELLAEQKEILGFSDGDVESFATIIPRIRNQYTHPDSQRTQVFPSGEDLYKYTQILRWTLTACLLQDIGVPKNLAATLLARNQRFAYFKEVILKKRKIEIMQVISRAPSTEQMTKTTDVGMAESESSSRNPSE